MNGITQVGRPLGLNVRQRTNREFGSSCMIMLYGETLVGNHAPHVRRSRFPCL